jgi:RsiW-degrading membrane proteinase PrsW (M82 family)
MSMADLQNLIVSGRVVDLVLAVMVVEALLLWFYHRSTGKGLTAVEIIITMLAGVFLLIAMRAALTGGDWTLIAMCLTASFAVHLTDLALRWRT